MWQDKHEGLHQIKASPTKAKPIKEEPNRGYSGNNPIESCVHRYHNGDISISVQSKRSFHLNIAIPNIAHII